MALARWQQTIVDGLGTIQPGASITVRREVAGAPLAQLYSDRAGTAPKSNPFTADGVTGFAFFYVIGGSYRIDATYGGVAAEPQRHVGIGTSSETDAGAIWTPTGAWDIATTYALGEAVEHGGYVFVSIVDDNLANEPDDTTPASDTDWMLAGIIPTLPPNTVTSTDVSSIIALTQSEYDALSPPDANTLYVIVEA